MRTWRRGVWLAASASAAAAAVLPARALVATAGGTRWTFEPAPAYDALEFAAPHVPALTVGGDVTAADLAFSERLTWSPTSSCASRTPSR